MDDQLKNSAGSYILDDSELSKFGADNARRLRVIPVLFSDESKGFITDRLEESLMDEILLRFGEMAHIEEVDTKRIDEVLQTFFSDSIARQKINGKALQDLRFLDDIIADAINLNSSDIHIECYVNSARIRIRIDGKLVDKYEIEKERYSYLVNKIKINSNLDISEKRLPQDGRMSVSVKGGVDIRVSVLPTLYSEKIVLRILKRGIASLDLSKIVEDNELLRQTQEQLLRPDGIALISGPTGSGKTTTLYSMLRKINSIDKNIITIEDPIEYTLPGVNQVQVKESIGMSFTSALRSVLRQDPDVIMVGEIRDENTAELAIRAALTGHLILSTIHTNSAWDAITRLVDMGIPPYLVSSTLNLSVAQRLVRLLCDRCKIRKNLHINDLPREYRTKVDFTDEYVPNGCSSCYGSGYRGRKAVMEVIVLNNNLRKEIIRTPIKSAEEIRQEFNITSIANEVFILLKLGLISLEDAFPFLMDN